MGIINGLKLLALIEKYHSEVKQLWKGETIKALDVFTFRAFGKTYSFSFYITCMKGE